jgi:TatD DNase family protein
MVAVGGDCDLNRASVNAGRAFPEHVSVAIGYDRDEAERLQADPGGPDDAVSQLAANVAVLDRDGPGVVALGEIGLDYHYRPESASQQEDLFERQLALARRLRKPVIVHSREADAATLRILAEHARTWPGEGDRIGVLHCFTGDERFAEGLLDLGFMISFSGIVSFASADPLREVARTIPGDRLLIETDTPYLAPVPHRGKPNEPSYLVDVARCVADVRSVLPEEIATVTTRNASRLFGVTRGE